MADQVEAAAAQPVRYWLGDSREHERALSVLARGVLYRYTIFEGSVRYVLTACPSGRVRQARPHVHGAKGAPWQAA